MKNVKQHHAALCALAHQYKDDMRHPITDSESKNRRIEAIDAVIEEAESNANELDNVRDTLTEVKDFLENYGMRSKPARNPEDDDDRVFFEDSDIQSLIELIDMILNNVKVEG
jgi:hypothetical protein